VAADRDPRDYDYDSDLDDAEEAAVAALVAAGASADARDVSGNTVLGNLVSRRPDRYLMHPGVHILMDAGADQAARDARGRTPLERGAESGSYFAVRYLLERGGRDPSGGALAGVLRAAEEDPSRGWTMYTETAAILMASGSALPDPAGLSGPARRELGRAALRFLELERDRHDTARRGVRQWCEAASGAAAAGGSSVP
jgi:hypothetical protein